jgi:hypothetical protein
VNSDLHRAVPVAYAAGGRCAAACVYLQSAERGASHRDPGLQLPLRRYSVHHRGYMMHRPHKITVAKRQFMAGNAIAAQASAAVRLCSRRPLRSH